MPYAPKTFRPAGADAARKAAERQYEKSPRRKEDHKFFHSARWLKLRKIVLAQCPLCIDCEAAGRIEPATEVDHVQKRATHPALAYSLENLVGRCKSCHSRKTRAGG